MKRRLQYHPITVHNMIKSMVVNHVVHLAGADAPQKPSQILGKKSND